MLLFNENNVDEGKYVSKLAFAGNELGFLARRNY